MLRAGNRRTLFDALVATIRAAIAEPAAITALSTQSCDLLLT